MSEETKKTKDGGFFKKVWKWLRWVLLAGIIIFLLIWGTPKVIDLFQKPAQPDVPAVEETISAENQAVLDALATISARVEKLEATPTLAASEVEEKEVVETSTPKPTLEATPTATIQPTEVVVAVVELKTADDFRALGLVNGWVSGGKDGEFVQGAQISFYEDFDLLSLPDGFIWEHECTQYQRRGDEIFAKAVCGDDTIARFSTEDSIVPAGTVGTFWAPGAVSASGLEKWDEGFLNAPCECPDGDCRDED